MAAAAAVVAGYHAAFPLEEAEVALLFALVGARLAVSVTTSALASLASWIFFSFLIPLAGSAVANASVPLPPLPPGFLLHKVSLEFTPRDAQ